MADRKRLTASEVEHLLRQHPELPLDYLAYLRSVGWGTAPSGHTIYSGPVSPDEIYPQLSSKSTRVIIGDDTQGYCLGYDFTAKRYGEYSDGGVWSSFDEQFDLAAHLANTM